MKSEFENQQYFKSLLAAIKIFDLSPKNREALSFFELIYQKLDAEQKVKAKNHFLLQANKFSLTDPEKTAGYKEIIAKLDSWQ